jgi:hypothetical protein
VAWLRSGGVLKRSLEYDSEIKEWRIPLVLTKEECQDREAAKSRNLQEQKGGGGSRTSSSVF